MANKLILGIVMFFCIAFQVVSAHTTTTHYVEKTENQEMRFSIDTTKLFFESGKVFFESEYNGILPLTSIYYLNGKCYTNLSFEVVDSYQGYICNHCGYSKIVEKGPPGRCPKCGEYDWTII